MLSFQDLGGFVHNNPETAAQRSYMHAALKDKKERERMRVTPLDFCIRVIVNENPLNLEKQHLVFSLYCY